MSVTTKTSSLSSLSPIKFTYKFNKEEKLKGMLYQYSEGLGYYQYELFKNYQDLALSKRNFVVLSDVKDLENVFSQTTNFLEIGTIAGCLFLKNQDGQTVRSLNDRLYMGGVGERAFINIVPIENNLVYLKLGNTSFLEIEEQYPYTVKVSDEILDEQQSNKRKFVLDYKGGEITFKILTAEGYRFLSYGVDKTIRAVGLELNDTIVNPYRFVAEFVSSASTDYNFDPHTTEIKYFNELLASANRKTVEIKNQIDRNTNLLITCPTFELAQNTEVPINLALAKTNFSSSGTYSLST